MLVAGIGLIILYALATLELDESVDMIRETLLQVRSLSSLDAPIGEDATSLLDQLADENQAAPDEDAERTSERARFQQALDHLTIREREVLQHYYGLEGEEEETLEQVGQRLGVTRERARQIKEKALNKLRYRLGPYLRDERAD